MRISDEKLKELLDDNQLEFTYGGSTGGMLTTVSMYIDEDDYLVDITFSRDGLIEETIILGEDDYVNLDKNQINFIYDMFDEIFRARQRQDTTNYYEWRERQDDILSYYIR
jgi:hypothetical protein